MCETKSREQEPCDAPTEGDPDDVGGGREEVLAVVGVGGGGQGPCWITRILVGFAYF